MREEKENKEEKRGGVLSELLSYAVMFVIALALAFLMNHFIIANAEVPTGSMEMTVMPKDRLVINRLSYIFDEPERGDIVMFKYPDDEKQDYLKRIIGLPGETVRIVNGLVYIDDNEEPLEEPYLPDPPNGDFGPYEVPEGCYFMLGDNRDISKDARFWKNHYVERDKIVGKALFRYYPNPTILHSAEYTIDADTETEE